MKLPEQTAVALFNRTFACWTEGKSCNAGSELNTAVSSDVRVFRGLWFYNRWHQTLLLNPYYTIAQTEFSPGLI
jgi:hypothetical protein